MARIIEITDGSITVDLLDASGFKLLLDGWPNSEPSAREVWGSSFFAAGRRPLLRAPNNVKEIFSMKLNTSGQDNAAANIQKLTRLIRQARNNYLTSWEQTPVYFKVKFSDETNTRYALIYDGRLDFTNSMDDVQYDSSQLIRGVTLTIEREPYWRSHVPQTLPDPIVIDAAGAPAVQAIDTEQHFANYRGNAALSHVYAYDDNLAAFSANQVAETAFPFFEVSGSTPALNDIHYFGAPVPWFNLVINIGTIKVALFDYALEYWDGGAWVSGPAVSPFFFEYLGMSSLSFEAETDWATTAINGQTLYWIRLRISNWTSWTTSPAQADQIVYTFADTYIEFDNTVIDGDIPALSLLRFYNYASDGIVVSHFILGAKSRGLTSFTSRLNCGADSLNPGAWAITMGTDTANASDVRAPDGEIALCTFATNQTMQERWIITNATATETIDWEGAYAVFARLEQSGGAIGDVSVQFKFEVQNSEWDSKVVTLTKVDSGSEIVGLGIISIWPVGIRTGESVFSDLEFHISAKSDNGNTPDLNLFDLVFIPVDEMALVAAESFDVTNSGIANGYLLDIDNGILREGCTVKSRDPSVDRIIIPIETRGKLPVLEPSRTTRIFMLLHDDNRAFTSLGGSMEIRSVERWLFLRGAE